MSAQSLDGGCDCGAVRFTLSSEPMFVHCCHCRWCQRESGSSYALNALIETDRIAVARGEPDPASVPSNSGKGQTIVRCPTCRVALWSHYAGAGNAIAFVKVGALDEPDRLPPDVQIYTESKQPWVVLSPDIPAFEQYYRRSSLWTEESLARRRAALSAAD